MGFILKATGGSSGGSSGTGTGIKKTASGGTISKGNRLVENEDGTVRNNINNNSKVVYKSDSSAFTSIAKLSNDRVVAIRAKNNGSLTGLACIGDNSSGSLVFGSEVEFFPAEVYYARVTSLGGNKFCIGWYANYAGNSRLRAKIGTVDENNNITLGSEIAIVNVSLNDDFDIRILDDTTVGCIYQNTADANKGYVKLFTINGTALDTLGTAVKVHDYGAYHPSIRAFESGKLGMCLRGNNTATYVTLATYSGAVPVLGTESNVQAQYVYNPQIAMLEEGRLIVAGGNAMYGNDMTIEVRDYTGTTVGTGYTDNVSTNTGYTGQIVIPDDGKWAITHRSGSTSGYLRIVTGIDKDSESEVTPESSLDTGSTRYNDSCLLNDNQLITVYRDNFNSNYATYVISDLYWVDNPDYIALDNEDFNRELHVLETS